MKRRIACLLICVCLLLCMALPAGAQDEGAAFTDRGRIRNVGAVQMLVDLGLISGYDDGTFRPGNFITREEVAKLVAILCTENPQAPADIYFYDAQKYFETACYMEPNSREYRNALNSIREAYTRQQQRSSGNDAHTTDASCCEALLCTSCCCNCLGGNRFRCC